MKKGEIKVHVKKKQTLHKLNVMMNAKQNDFQHFHIDTRHIWCVCQCAYACVYVSVNDWLCVNVFLNFAVGED